MWYSYQRELDKCLYEIGLKKPKTQKTNTYFASAPNNYFHGMSGVYVPSSDTHLILI
jgi:hypothetical protein